MMLARVVVVLAIGCGGDRTDRAAALQRCADAFAKMASADLGDYTRLYARGCADLYRAPGCHDAVANLAETKPDDRLVALSRSCAVAYCGSIPGPAPALCIPGASKLADDELVAAWKVLDGRILALELGLDPRSKEVERLAGAFPHEVVVKRDQVDRPLIARPTPRVNQRLEVVATDDRIVLRLDGHEWSVPTSPTPADLAPLVDALDKRVGITIATSPDTQYAVIVSLLDAVHAAGISEIAFSSDTP